MAEHPSNAWNHPIHNEDRRETGRKATKTLLIGFIAAVVLICSAILYLYYCQIDTSEENRLEKKSAMIAEVKPSISTRNIAAKVEEKKVDPKARPTKVGEVVNGYVKLPSGRIHKRVGIITNSASHHVKNEYQIFKRQCDNEIAAFLWMKPGHGIVAMPPYNGRFKKEFLESLKEPIAISSDDTPEQAELKKAVKDAKADLKAALDRGEDIEQIMMETRKEMISLSQYKRELEQQLLEFRKREDVSDQDVDDFLTACNQLLDKKGITPMTLGPIMRRKLTMKHQGEE